MDEVRDAYLTLRQYRKRLTRQQVRTLAGQIKSGHHNEAMNGLDKILDRRGRVDAGRVERKNNRCLSASRDV